jgi:phosphate:Na+ symporter
MLWKLFAGLSLFMVGIQELENALLSATGVKLKNWLKRLNQHPFYAILGGTVCAGILQSSSVVNLMILSFVGAGILGMKNSLYLMMGANIGSTVSSWMVSLIGFSVGVEQYAQFLLVVSLPMVLFSDKGSVLSKISAVFIYFALVLIGLIWLRQGGELLISQVDVKLLHHLPMLVFILLGFILTAIVQSSSPIIAIALTALYHQSIDFSQTASMILGAEIGSSLKYVIASIGGIPIKKQVAYANFILNIMTLFVGLVMIFFFTSPLFSGLFEAMSLTEDMLKIPVFQTLINVLSIFVFIPFIPKLSKKLESYFPSSAVQITEFLQLADQKDKHESSTLALLESKRLANLVVYQIKEVLGLKKNQSESWQDYFKSLWKNQDEFQMQYEHCKQLQAGIIAFLSPKLINQDQTEPLILANQNLLKAIKNIKDIKHNIVVLEELSTEELLYPLWQSTKDFLSQSLQKYHEVLNATTNDQIIDFNEWIEDNHRFFQEKMDQNIVLLQNENLEHIQGATQLNVLRELQASMKALIKSLESFKAYR